MANLPLAFGELLAGGVALVAGVSGSSIADTIRGNVTMHPFPNPFGGGASAPSKPGTGTTAVPTNASETAFWGAVLKSLGAPASKANISSLSQWLGKEFGGWPPHAANNPLATTEPGPPGTTSFNSVGVRNYPSAAAGVAATVRVLQGGYPCIIAALRSGSGLCGQCAQDFSKWSGGGYSGVC